MFSSSTNDRYTVNNVSQPNQMNTRPKFQPVRVKALLHFYESDDEESEDKTLDSDNESDIDDLQSQPQDDLLKDGLNESVSQIDNTDIPPNSQDKDNILVAINERSIPIVSSNQEKSASNDNIKVCKVSDTFLEGFAPKCVSNEHSDTYKCKDASQETTVLLHEIEHNIKDEKSSEQVNHFQSQSCRQNESHVQKQVSEEQLYDKNEMFLKDQQIIESTDSLSITSQNSGLIPQSSIYNAQSTNIKSEVLEQRVLTHEDVSQQCCENKNPNSHLVTETPLKHGGVGPMHPNPCMSRKNIIQTPQNELKTGLLKNHGLTPATALCQWSQNNTKQTPLQKNQINSKNCLKTPQSSICLTAGRVEQETPRYFSNSVRRPLADTGSFKRNDVPYRRQLLGSQVSKMDITTPKSENNLSRNHNLNNKNNAVERILEVSENDAEPLSEISRPSKEDKHPIMIDALDYRETSLKNKIPEIKEANSVNTKLESKSSSVRMYDKDGKVVSKSNYDSQNQYSASSSQSRLSTANNQNQHSMGINQNQHPVGSNQNQQPAGSNQNQQPVGSNRNKYSVGSSQNQASVGSSQNQASVGSSQNQASVGSSQNQASVGSSQNQASVGSSQNQPSVGSSQSQPSVGSSQNQPSVGSNQCQQQQQNARTAVNEAPNVQFSMTSNVPMSRQNRVLFVKGKEYLILGILGQGMSGEVLRVQNVSTLELCAIKCVNLSRMDKDSAQGCLEEISMLHKLQAPCIVRMFDYEIKYPMVYVVMEMGDTDLSRLLKSISQEKQLPLTMILYYWTEMLTAVKHIHDNGVIHSDLKPANFLLVRGRLKLIDFGIASSINADMTSVVKNCPIGTLNYISPEALMDIGGNSDSPTHNVIYKISYKSDVWSLGCILYSLIYGHTPFHHIRAQWAKVNAITNPKPNISFPTTLPSNEGDNKSIPFPPILIDVMRKCLQHDPKARPTVAQLLQIQYIPIKPERVSTSIPDIPTNILLKIKQTLNDKEWRQLTQTNRPSFNPFSVR